MRQAGQRSGGHTERRILDGHYAPGPPGQTRDPSPRQLPTDHDHDGEPPRSIRAYQSDQPSYAPPRPLPGLPHEQGGTLTPPKVDLTSRSISVS